MSPQKPVLTMVAVPPEEYASYADGLREFHPHSYQIEGTLRIHCMYRHLSVLNSTLYAPSDPQLRHKMAVITPVCAVREILNFSVFWSDTDISEDTAYHLLLSLPFNWRSPCTVRQMPFHLQPAMHKILHKLSGGLLNRVSPIPTLVFALSPEDTPPVPRLPEGYYFKKLDGSYAKEVLNYWSPNFTETTATMSFFLETLPNVGIFYRKKSEAENEENIGPNLNEFSGRNELARRTNGENITNNSGLNNVTAFGRRTQAEEDSGDELASYVVFKHGGDTGMTFTHEKHRRKGLGRAVTLYVAHELHSKGLLVAVNVVFDNEMSINMHKEMGFKYLTHSSFPVYLPEKFDPESVPRFPIFLNAFSSTPDRWLDISDME